MLDESFNKITGYGAPNSYTESNDVLKHKKMK